MEGRPQRVIPDAQSFCEVAEMSEQIEVEQMAKIAARGAKCGRPLTDEDERVLIDNIEAQIIYARACERRKIDVETRSVRTELELAKIDLQRGREEFDEELRKRETMIVDAEFENERLKEALAAVNELLRTYIVKGGE